MDKKIFWILLSVVLIAGLIGSGTLTGANFVDTETASGNTLSAWESAKWTQTDQEEFEVGTLHNVDTASDPGSVRLNTSVPWYDSNWNYRKQITIDHTQVGSSLSNFPVLVSLPSDSDLVSHAQTSGNDILFTAADATTKLDHEIEKYTSTTGQLVAWVNVPYVSDTEDTQIYMYYGNPSAVNQQNPTAVWDNDFKAVWHLKETSGISITDSTSNSNNGTPSNVTLNAVGKIDGGDSFNGSTSYTSLGPGTSLNFAAGAAFSLEGWFKTSDSYGPIVSFRNSSSGGADIDICLGYDGAGNSSAGSLMAIVRGDLGSAGYARVSGPVVNNNIWHYFVLTRNTSGTIQLFCDGTSCGTASGSESGWAVNSNLRALACERRWVQDGFTTPDNTYLNATLDEFRVSGAQLSSGWITTAYNNQNAPDMFISLGTQEIYPSSGNASLLLFWDGTGSLPSGWTDVSAAGQPFYNLFPRGAATYGDTDGDEIHTHVNTDLSENGTIAVRSGTSAYVASASHLHSLTNVTVSSVSNLPAYRNLRIIRYDNGIPSIIPEGAIAIFDAAVPSGWTRYSSEDDYFIRSSAEADLGYTGGSNTHNHTVSASVSNQAATVRVSTTSTTTQVATSNHSHTINGTTSSADNRPPYITVILAQADRNVNLPGGMIGMFDADPGSRWSVLSNDGGDFNSRFLVGSDLYGITGGADTHTHTMTSGTPTGTRTARTNSSNTTAASSTHTHTIIFNDQSNIPPYRDVIIAKAEVSGISISGTLDSQIYDTGSSGTQMDALFWDTDILEGTDISLSVRASDDESQLASQEWIPVSDISPALAGLPSGQYMQWQATLTSNNGTITPVLFEVRLYYYHD